MMQYPLQKAREMGINFKNACKNGKREKITNVICFKKTYD